MESFIHNTVELILIIIFGITFIIQLFYYFTFYNKIYRNTKNSLKGKIEYTNSLPPLSVIICAKNDSDSLKTNLPLILEQNYPLYEVIVVNESSTDDSEDQLKLMEEKYPNLYHTFIPDSSRCISRKKLAITVGIKASKHEWLIFTEPECSPVSKDWLKTLARNFTDSTQIVLGYSGYYSHKGWLCQKIKFDNLFTAMRYLGFAINKHPYMGIGKNMAYRKSLFYNNKGFSSHLNLQRGEDDLFINKVANSHNLRVETYLPAIIRANSPKNARQWREEKISYGITSSYYKGMQRYLSGFETFSRLLFYGSMIALLVFSFINHAWILSGSVLGIFLFRFFLQLFIFNKTAATLNEKGYFLQLPLLEILQPFHSLQIRTYKLLKKKNEFMRK